MKNKFVGELFGNTTILLFQAEGEKILIMRFSCNYDFQAYD